MNTTTNVIAIQALPGVGPKTSRSLINFLAQATDEQEFIERVLGQQRTTRRLARLTTKSIQRAYGDALDVVSESAACGIDIHTILDSSYPSRLTALQDAPCVLFSRGGIAALHCDRLVAIVGTREPSPFGKIQATRVARHFAERRTPVVSGLALGCDIAAHRACNALDAPSVAVLAHGLDSLHPATHRKDAERVLEAGGCWISEYPVGTEVRPYQFVRRNRLQIGLSDALVVIETNVNGGTMHTAEFANRQRKPIVALEHTARMAHIDQAQGNQLLIARGARALAAEESPDSIFEQVSQQGQLF